MCRVTINGREWRQFDPAKEIAVLPANENRVLVTAYF
jgi:hypothetical protein